MPTVRRFNRCRIEMYFGDHPPPHFHVITRNDEAVVYLIETLALWAGEADPRDAAEALAWAAETGGAVGAMAPVFRGGVMSEVKAIRVAEVKHAGEYRLRVRFASGKTLTVDLRELVHRLKGLRPLRDIAVLARASVGESGHSVAWPGELDVGADRLFELALEQNGRADVVEFIRWRWRHGLSLTAAAEALGLSRRQIAYYASGEHEVPRTVLLACKGWEAERQAAA